MSQNSETTASTEKAGYSDFKLWFDDGNVVVRMPCGAAFRVYRGTLCRESPVFADMFSVPQDGHEVEMYEDTGCPVVDLPDERLGVELLLSVIFDPNALDERCGLREHILLLGIATKYLADRVLKRILPVLEHDFPSTLSGWDHLGECECCVRIRHMCFAEPCEFPSDEDLLLMLQVAATTGMTIFLPAVYLFLCLQPSETLLTNKTYDALSRAELQTLMLGQRHLYTIVREDTFSTLFNVVDSQSISAQCLDPASCDITRRQIISEVIEIDRAGTLHALCRFYFQDLPARTLCKYCAGEVFSDNAPKRAMTWDALPAQFYLPPWTELRASRGSLLAEA